ncbi:hypothetical protein Hanom_Chr12g01105221 [Helianthus anomalus]
MVFHLSKRVLHQCPSLHPLLYPSELLHMKTLCLQVKQHVCHKFGAHRCLELLLRNLDALEYYLNHHQ